MTLDHEKLDVYRLSIGYVTWVYEMAETLIEVHRPARDQWLRANQNADVGTRPVLLVSETILSEP